MSVCLFMTEFLIVNNQTAIPSNLPNDAFQTFSSAITT